MDSIQTYWQEYRCATLPQSMGPLQQHDNQLSFFAGASVVLAMLRQCSNEDEMRMKLATLWSESLIFNTMEVQSIAEARGLNGTLQSRTGDLIK